MDAICLTLRPYDETASVTLEGPPFPFGVSPYETDQEYTFLGAETPLYFSDIGYRSQDSDDPTNTYFEPRLESSFNYQIRLWQGDEPTGRTRAGFGDITIINTEGDFDAHLNKGWVGRELTLHQVDQDSAFSTATVLFRGAAEGLVWDEGTVSIRLRDRQERFTRLVQTVFYSGDGGAEGSEDVKGKPKPIAFGDALNVPALLIDPTNLVYQVTDFLLPIQEGQKFFGITEVRDQGVVLTGVGRAGSVYGVTPGAGEWIFDDVGLIRLGALPAGSITADIRNVVPGPPTDPTFGEIVRNIVTTRLGSDSLADPDELDTAAFTALDATEPTASIETNFWVGSDESPSVGDVLDRLFASIGGYWYMTLDGKFSCGVLTAPAAPADHTLTEADIGTAPKLERTRTPLPSYRRRVGYAPIWLVQTPDSLAGSVSAADISTYGEAFRVAQAETLSIRTKHPLAQNVLGGGLFGTSANAEIEADRLLTLHGAERGIYRLNVQRDPFAIQVGETVAISNLGRFGFAATEHFLVIGVVADALRDELTLELWG